MCREGAWVELTVEVTHRDAIRSRTHGLKFLFYFGFVFSIYIFARRLLRGFVIFLAAWRAKIMPGFNCLKTKSEF